MKHLSEWIKSLLAGIMISIGGIVFLSCENKVVGALLFSTGLMTVVCFGMNLYTGKIGYVIEQDATFFLDTVLSILGNAVGCLAVGLAKSPVGAVSDVVANKLNKTWPAVFIDAILCGILIYVCVDVYKKKNKLIAVFFCIPTFILCGFEHSIADMFYFFNARVFQVQGLWFLLTVVAGNAVGGLLIPVLFKLSEACAKERKE